MQDEIEELLTLADECREWARREWENDGTRKQFLRLAEKLDNIAKYFADDDFKPGDIVQIAPGTVNRMFCGCFMVVTEIRSWGAIGYFPTFGTHDEEGGIAPFRAENGSFERVGKAKWIVR